MKTFSRSSGVYASNLTENGANLIGHSNKTIEKIKSKYKNDNLLNYASTDNECVERRRGERERDTHTETEAEGEEKDETDKEKVSSHLSYVSSKNVNGAKKGSIQNGTNFIDKYKNLFTKSSNSNGRIRQESNTNDKSSIKRILFDRNNFHTTNRSHLLVNNAKKNNYDNFTNERNRLPNKAPSYDSSNRNCSDAVSSKRKFHALGEINTNRHVDLEMYESLYRFHKKHTHSRQVSENIHKFSGAHAKEKDNDNAVLDSCEDIKKEEDKMNNYEMYKDNIHDGDYMDHLKGAKMKNMFLRDEDNKRNNEDSNEGNFNFPYSNRTYKDHLSNNQDIAFKNNIRYTSAAMDIPNPSNSNKLDLNMLYNNDMEKLNSNLSAYNDSNKLSQLQEKYKNNFLYEREFPSHVHDVKERTGSKTKKDHGEMYSNNVVLYSDTGSKSEFRGNFLNHAGNGAPNGAVSGVANHTMSNRTAREENFPSEKKSSAETESEMMNRYNYSSHTRHKAATNDSAMSRRQKILENLMNINKNSDEERSRSNARLNSVKKHYADNTFYNNKNTLHLDNKNPHHRRSSSTNVNLGRHDIDRVSNYVTYADDTQAKVTYYHERESGTISGYEKYLHLKNGNNNGLLSRNVPGDGGANEPGAKPSYDGVQANAHRSAHDTIHMNGNNAEAQRNVLDANHGHGEALRSASNAGTQKSSHELGGLRNLDFNELRKKHMNIISHNNEKGGNYLHKKEAYEDERNESYNVCLTNEKNKMQPIISNYEDLFSFDKNIKKKNDIKNIVCVCQASKQMARLQLHMEEGRQMLETEKNLFKKKKDNFEKKVEMLAEKEKEIDKIHSQIKEKEVTIDKKKNEIEEKEKYINSIKNKYDNAQKELLEKMNECINIENKCKSKLYEYDEKFGLFNKRIKEMEEREKEIENERKNIERKEKILSNDRKELEEEKMLNMKEKNELEMLKKELDSLEKEKKKIIECEYSNLQNKEEELRRNERSNLIKENELKSRIDKYNELIDELNKSKKELENERIKMMDQLENEKMKFANEKKHLEIEKENERSYMKEELNKERMLMVGDVDKMKMIMMEDMERTKNSMLDNVEKENKRMREEVENERRAMLKSMEEDKDKFQMYVEKKCKENLENEKLTLEKKYKEEANKLQNEIANERKKILKDRDSFEQQKKIYEEEFRSKCEKYEESIQKKYEMLDEEKSKMKYLIMKEQEELENFKKRVYLDIEEEKDKLYVQQEKLNLEKENLQVEKEQIEIELKNYKNFKEKEENDIKIRIINLSQQQEDLNKEKENIEKEKEEMEKRRFDLDEREQCLHNDKLQVEESRKIFDEQLEKIKKNKEELLNYDKDLKKKEINLIEKEKEQKKNEDELYKKKEKLNEFDSDLKEYSGKLQGREKKLKEKKNELQKVKDQLVNYKNSLKQKEVQFQMIEKREKELIDEQTVIQIDRNSLEAEKKQFLLMKEKHDKDTEFIQEQLKLLHEQLKNKEKSLKEKENEINLLNKLQNCRGKSAKGAIISLKNLENRKLSSNLSRASNSKNRVKVKIIGKNRLDLIRRKNRKKSINFHYNNLEINNSIQYIDSMINENFKNKPFLKYKNGNSLGLSEAFQPNDQVRNSDMRINTAVKEGNQGESNRTATYDSSAPQVDHSYSHINDKGGVNVSTYGRKKTAEYSLPSDGGHYSENSSKNKHPGSGNLIGNAGTKSRGNFEKEPFNQVNNFGLNGDHRVVNNNDMVGYAADDLTNHMDSHTNEYVENYKENADANKDYFGGPGNRHYRKDSGKMEAQSYGSQEGRSGSSAAVKGNYGYGGEHGETVEEGRYERQHDGYTIGNNTGSPNEGIFSNGSGNRDVRDSRGIRDNRDNRNKRNNHNSYNINNLSTKIKMGNSNLTYGSNSKSTSRMNFKEHRLQEHGEDMLASLNVNNLIESDLIEVKSNYGNFTGKENSKYDGDLLLTNYEQRDMNVMMGEEQEQQQDEKQQAGGKNYGHYAETREPKQDVQRIDTINKNISTINDDVDHINSNISNIKGNLHKINSHVHGGEDIRRGFPPKGDGGIGAQKGKGNDQVSKNKNRNGNRDGNGKNLVPLNQIDNLVNRNMQSINHMSSLMQSGKKMKAALNKQTEYCRMASQAKNKDKGNTDKDIRDKFFNYNNEENDTIKKESSFNEFLEDINSDKYYGNAGKGVSEKENEDFYHNMEKSLNGRNMNDSYDYKNLGKPSGGGGYEEDYSHEYGGGTHNRSGYDTTNPSLQTAPQKKTNVRMMPDNGYNSDSNVLRGNNFTSSEENCRRLHSNSIPHGNENNFKTRNNSSNVYYNNDQNVPRSYRNDVTRNMRSKKQEFYEDNFVLNTNEQKHTFYDKSGKHLDPVGNPTVREGGIGDNKSNTAYMRRPDADGSVSANPNAYMGKHASKGDGRGGNKASLVDPSSKRNVHRSASNNANKNTNLVGIKGFMKGMQNGREAGTAGSGGNSIIEQLDKTLLNKSIMMNKTKKK
ncbi:hypothetical protein C922_05196 [Plasmodium inui San Antonio 1]|uniref:Uncharacterized protein n=1 Tax=Plasmodium inui San Antonio 1 TaxID=1237626 RepID=W7AGI3_9APIC|nr:hypothetical protein C922_05196 [Plasmodium inui San Antonio 1]EUD64421.1 hypothetical protein C922_05196 [Plasmodium inui San Antonio 1]